MTEIEIPQEVQDQVLANEVLVYCINCEIVLYSHEKEGMVSNHVANQAALGHGTDLGHRVLRFGKQEVVI